jgi:hypothetical protein
MRSSSQVTVALVSAAVCMMLTGCFSYSREVSHTSEPAAVEVPVAPATSSTTTTTTDNGLVERQRTVTTYP